MNAREWLAAETPGATAVALLGAPISKASISPSEAWSTPPALRAALARFATWDAQHGIDVESMRIDDLGDIAGDRDEPDATAAHVRIHAAVAAATARASTVFVIGGDNSLTRPAMQGAMAASPDRVWGLITLDAHHDCRPPDQGSPVRLDGAFDLPPPLDRQAVVAERKGCDLDPIDPTSEEGSLSLRSFIWADQLERFRLLEGAIEVARRVPAQVERIDALAFLRRELSLPRPGMTTVVYHSVFTQYLDEQTRRDIDVAIEAARVARLSMEPGEGTFEVRLDGRLLATTKAHGTGVRWIVS